MSKKSKILLCVIGIFLVTSILIGISFAYYIFRVSQSGSNIVRTDCFEITYTDGNAINLTNAIPLTDKEAKKLEPYTFTIKNICNNIMEYSVNIETLEETTMDLNAVAVSVDNKSKKVLGVLNNNENIINNGVGSSKTIYKSGLNSGEEKTHNLRLWIDENATSAQSENKKYYSKIVIQGKLNPEYKKSTLISGPLFNKTIKQLSGYEIDQDQLEQIDEMYAQNEEFINLYSGKSSEQFALYQQNSEELQNMTYEEFTRRMILLLTNVQFSSAVMFYDTVDLSQYTALGVTRTDDIPIKSIEFSDSMPLEDTNAVVVSTEDSGYKIFAWYDNKTIYLYSESDDIYLNTNSSFYFSGLELLNYIDLSRFEFSDATTMKAMFAGDKELKDVKYGILNTQKVTDMSFMFAYSYCFLDSYDDIDTSNVTNMREMFRNSLVRNENFDSLNTSNVENMSGMFSSVRSYNASLELINNYSVQDIDSDLIDEVYGKYANRFKFDGIDTMNAKYMSSMFYNLDYLTSLDLRNYNTSNVISMIGMFESSFSLLSLDISNFDTSNVENMSYMFHDCNKLTTIYVGNGWNTSNITIEENSNNMFKGSKELIGGSGTTYDSSHIDKEYARVDDSQNGKPGYFTLKTN